MNPLSDNGVGSPFLILLFGQLVSILGSSLTAFGLAIWIVQSSDSILDYALSLLFFAIPGILLAPWVGSVADRYNKRTLLIVSDVASVIITVIMALLLCFDLLTVNIVYGLGFITAIFGLLQSVVFNALIVHLVPLKSLNRANGMGGFCVSLTGVIAPVLAGILIFSIGLVGVMVLDVLTFVVGIVSIFFVAFPKASNTASENADRFSVLAKKLFSEFFEVVKFIKSYPFLRAFLGYSVLNNSIVAMVTVLLTPLILIQYNEVTLGSVMSVSAVGALCGAVFAMIWSPKNNMKILLLSNFFIGVSVFFVGFTSLLPVIFVATFSVALFGACSGSFEKTIWQTKVATELQGRFFALISSLDSMAMPLVAMLAAILIDNYFAVWMATGGPLADSLGMVIGVGEGRGISLMLVLGGIFYMFFTVLMLKYLAVKGGSFVSAEQDNNKNDSKAVELSS